MGFLTNLMGKLKRDDYFDVSSEPDVDKDYLNVGDDSEDGKAKIIVRSFVLENFEDVKPVLDSLREGYTITLVNIKPLKDKDLIELKRAINKMKKTCEAIEGDIAGFGEDWITVVPSFATIHREKRMTPVERDFNTQ
ncbi:cell division protein SepF [Nanoarchaeota archaeon]